jgi:hypothetical protein
VPYAAASPGARAAFAARSSPAIAIALAKSSASAMAARSRSSASVVRCMSPTAAAPRSSIETVRNWPTSPFSRRIPASALRVPKPKVAGSRPVSRSKNLCDLAP